jgi:hypothetical protein
VEISTLVRHPTELVREAIGYLRQMAPRSEPSRRGSNGAGPATRA